MRNLQLETLEDKRGQRKARQQNVEVNPPQSEICVVFVAVMAETELRQDTTSESLEHVQQD